MNEIAQRTGISRSTVSRVLNGDPRVAPETRSAVLAAVEELQYRPNLAAQGLARGRSQTIGVLTQGITSTFYGEFLKGVEEGLAGSCYHPIFISSNQQVQDEISVIDQLIARRIDGLVLLGSDFSDDLLRSLAEQIPLIAIGRTISGLDDQCVRMENFQGAYDATCYLIELGHRRIAHIAGTAAHIDSKDRYRGYCQALTNVGLPVDPALIVEGHFTEQSGLLALEALFSRAAMFTAIFAANDQMAYGARLGLFRRGLRVPEDVSLVGFDDQLNSAYCTPPLTTVRQPNIQMGRAAAQAVLGLLNGQKSQIPSFSPELVIRESATVCRQSGFGFARTVGR